MSGQPVSVPRRVLRAVVPVAIRFFTAHPRVHDGVKRAYAHVPGLQRRLRRLLPPVGAAVQDRWVFRPIPPDEGGALTIENLYHLVDQRLAADR